jgi:uncharacterized membrane protein
MVTAAGVTPGRNKEVRQVSKSRQQRRTASRNQARSQVSSDQRRQEKRAQFEAPKRRTGLHIAMAVAALAVVAIVAVVIVNGRSGGETATATTAAPSGDVTMPVAQVNDGKAHFYTYDAGGTTVKYFVLADKTGKVRAALDACEVCYAQKKGYHQQGDAMQCNNCGKIFPSAQINVITGGCNPIPLKRSISGDTLTITTDSLQSGAQYF